MTLSDAIARLQIHAQTIMNGAHPTYPPEAEGVGTYSIAYEQGGTYTPQSAGWALDFPTVVVEMHIQRHHLPLDVQTAMTYRLPYCQLLRDDPTLNGTVSTIRDIRYRLVTFGEGEEAEVGYRFEIDIKMNA